MCHHPLTALVAVILLGVAALGVDITTQVNERSEVHDTIDAAAQPVPIAFPNAGTQASAERPMPTPEEHTVWRGAVRRRLFCVVASMWNGVAGPWTPQIRRTCNPARRTATRAPVQLDEVFHPVQPVGRRRLQHGTGVRHQAGAVRLRPGDRHQQRLDRFR